MSKRKVFGLLIIIIGVLALAITPIMNLYIKNKVESSLTDFNTLSAEDLNKNKDGDGDFNFDNLDEISPSKVILNPGEINKDLIIGQMVIPNIKANLTMFKGLSNNELLAGVGTMKKDQVMGRGNYSIAGHYAKNNTLLGNLISVNKGDIIRITDKIKTYEYKVYDTQRVSPTSVNLIEDTVSEERGNPIVTVMNCYYKDGKNTGDRYFVFGDLVTVKDYIESDINSGIN
ncbi:class A sortase [Miniphocaeibacter massiliensis]|uniref:class A sortase n=1 Tax=Miniphocaeibacter massiliensis TaxID=2041841 RepID=UPI000C1C0C92|nr:class A sortase [Miniphocaeibacter massiliensis]